MHEKDKLFPTSNRPTIETLKKVESNMKYIIIIHRY